MPASRRSIGRFPGPITAVRFAAARLSSRNGAAEGAEPTILDGPTGAGLRALGHNLVSAGTPNEIGAVTAIRSLADGQFEAAAETVRRGGGSAMVVDPR